MAEAEMGVVMAEEETEEEKGLQHTRRALLLFTQHAWTWPLLVRSCCLRTDTPQTDAGRASLSGFRRADARPM